MRKRDIKYVKRLTRFFELAQKRDIHWIVKHVDRETANAARAYRILMGKPISKKMAAVGLTGAILLNGDWQ